MKSPFRIKHLAAAALALISGSAFAFPLGPCDGGVATPGDYIVRTRYLNSSFVPYAGPTGLNEIFYVEFRVERGTGLRHLQSLSLHLHYSTAQLQNAAAQFTQLAALDSPPFAPYNANPWGAGDFWAADIGGQSNQTNEGAIPGGGAGTCPGCTDGIAFTNVYRRITMAWNGTTPLLPDENSLGDPAPFVDPGVPQPFVRLRFRTLAAGFVPPVKMSLIDDPQSTRPLEEVCSSGGTGNRALTTRAAGHLLDDASLLASFMDFGATATAVGDPVVVNWETATEDGTVGFHVYRADYAPETGFALGTQLTSSLIPAQGSATSGSTYVYIDAEPIASNSEVRWYYLEERDINGGSTFHGPTATAALTSGPTAVQNWELYAY